MKYPEEILPTPGYKLIDCKIEEYHLVRHTPTTDNWDHDVDLIYEKSICDPSSSNMPDLSTSLFSIFQLDYITIRITNKDLLVYCPPNISVKAPVFNQDFILEIDRGCWFVEISRIEGQKAMYQYGDEAFEAICRIVHTPMKWNYWHFAIRWYLVKEQCFWHDLDERDKKKKWSKERLAHESRSLVRMHASTGVPALVELDRPCYVAE